MNPLSPATQRAYALLAERLAHRQGARFKIVGINGAQGTGKSTLARFLVDELRDRHRLRALAVSLDDFYLGRAARAQLAVTIHPLLATRGVPGTHDATVGLATLRSLRALRPQATCTLPRFSKAEDDVQPGETVSGPFDLLLFEGWCVGTPPQDEAALQDPVNELEREWDPDGYWRRHVNAQLAGPYMRWFAELDALVFLQAPGWDQVRQWRAQQEVETAAAHGGRSALLDESAREHFLQHYRRLTDHALRVLPGRAQALIELGADHEVKALRLA